MCVACAVLLATPSVQSVKLHPHISDWKKHIPKHVFTLHNLICMQYFVLNYPRCAYFYIFLEQLIKNLKSI